MKKTILSMVLLAAGCFNASAQEAKAEEVFNPHWYVQGQVGMQHTLGEIKWTGLNSLNAQVAAGYQFSKLFGARLTVGGWQSRGGIEMRGTEYKYKWNYVAPTLNLTFNVTNALLGYNPNRLVDVNIFAGGGLNMPWGNDEAKDVDNTMRNVYKVTADQVEFMHYINDADKIRPVGQFGASVDFNVSKRVAIGLEANCNILSDKYNSKKAGNADWYFNGLVGVKVALGPKTKVNKVEAKAETPAPVVVEEKKEEPRRVAEVKVVAKKEPIRRDIFFVIRGSEVSSTEMTKVQEIADYMKRYPEAKVTVTGYADKGTGNPKINVGYAKKRADMVASILKEKFGISESRITVDSKGDTVQPYEENDMNRVSICIAE